MTTHVRHLTAPQGGAPSFAPVTAPPPSLRRLAGVLLALAVVPALAFAAAQVFVQSESEAQLARLRDDQLDGLLFSVNQNAWDVATTWTDRLDRAQASDHPRQVGAGGPGAEAFVGATPAVPSFVVADTAFRSVATYGGTAEAEALALREAVAPATVRALLSQRALGYRKLEPAPLPSGRLGLVFVADGAPRACSA